MTAAAPKLVPGLPPAFVLDAIVPECWILHSPCCHGGITLAIPLPQGILANINEEEVKWEKSDEPIQLKGQQHGEENK